MKMIFNIQAQAILLTILFFIGRENRAKAQDPIYTFSAGYGFFYNDPLLRESTFKEEKQSLVGPIYLSVEKRTNDFSDAKGTEGKFAFGITFIYYHAVWNQPGYKVVHMDSTWTTVDDTWVNQVNAYSGVFRINYHLLRGKKFDPYFGIGVGFKIVKLDLDPDNPGCSGENCSYGWPYGLEYHWPIVLEATAGLRYHIVRHLSVFCEMGYSKCALQSGIACQF